MKPTKLYVMRTPDGTVLEAGSRAGLLRLYAEHRRHPAAMQTTRQGAMAAKASRLRGRRRR